MPRTLSLPPSPSVPARRAALPAALLLALAAPVQAEAVADAQELDAVQVTGQRVDNRSAMATRLDLSLRETPQSVSVLDRDLLDDFALTSANDALGLVPGVGVEQVETDRTYYTARGFDIVNFQRDGLGLPLPYGIQNGDLDTAPYERIEVLRGANGLMSSTGNPSATVNFVRKRPTEAFQGSVAVALGSWDTWRVDADVSGPLGAGGAVRGRAVAAWEEGDSYLDRHAREKQVAYAVVEADLGTSTVLAAGASYQHNRPQSPLWGALPLYYTDGTPTRFDVSTSTAADWAYWDGRDARVFVDLAHGFGNGWQARVALNHEDLRDDTQLFYVYGTPDRETGLGLFAYPSDYAGHYRASFADAWASGPLRLFGREHEVVAGASVARGRNQETSWYGNDIGTPLPPLEEFDGRYPKPAFDAFSDGSDYDYARSSLYATVRWNLHDRLKLVTGASRSRVDTEGHSYGEPNDFDDTRTTPFAGLVLDLGRHHSLYASHGEIFNPQSETDAENRLVGALTGDNAELGWKGEWLDGALNASLALFRARQRNLAEAAGFDPGTGRTYYAGIDAESRGYEAEIAGHVANWRLSAGYARLRIEDDDGAAARTYVPRQTLRVAATWQAPLPGLRLGARLRWQDAIHDDQVAQAADGTATPVRVRQDAYALLGLMARYDFAGRWNVTLNVDNATDEKYIPSLYWDQAFYGAPRSATLTVGYRF